jgi:fimbrial isopeptide formation D2 family protein/uncharacterized repeat protein (TIGR01451 family)
VANGQTVTNLNPTPSLPNNLQFVNVNSTTINGSSTSTASMSLPSTTTPGSTLTLQFASVNGTSNPNSAQMLFTVYVPLTDASGNAVLNATTGAATTAVLNTSLQGTWNSTSVTSSQTPAHTLNVNSIASQQSAAVYTSVNTANPSPGDTLEYTINFQAPDYFSFQNVHVTDVISDGQKFDSTFTPTLTVNGNGFTLPVAAFHVADYTVTPNSTTGTTAFDFQVSSEMITRGQNGRLLGGLVSPSGSGLVAAPGAGPITGTVKFHTVIQQTYTAAYTAPNNIVKQGDSLTSSGVVSGDVISNTNFVPTGNNVTEAHLASVTVPTTTVQASIYAINANTTLPSPLLVTAGDTVTYRLTDTLPTSNVANLVVTDFVPPPVYNAANVTTFNNVSGSTPPAVNAAALGPNDTFHSYFPSVTPTMSSTTTNGNNELVFSYGNNTDSSQRTSVIDLLFTARIGGQPFPDGTPLTNLVHSTDQNSTGAVNAVDALAQTTLIEPSIPRITKGVVSTSNPHGVFSASRAPAGVTFGAPGTTPGFSGTITSGGLAVTPITASLSTVDANDLVRFAIVIENVGEGKNGAYNVEFQDTMPSGFAIPSGGLDLSVTDGSGAALTTTDLGGGLLGSGLKLNDPGSTGALSPGKDTSGNTINTGHNIAVITYDLQTVSTVNPSQVLTNTATLVNFASIPGGPNFEAGLTGTTKVTIAYPQVAKIVTAVNQSFTTVPNVTIGEVATYQLTLTIPEGVMPNAQLVDTLPAGLAIVSLDSLTASSNLQTSVSGGFPAVLSGAAVGTNGSSATFNFGTITNTGTSDSGGDTIDIGYHVVALNVSANQRGTVDKNYAKLSWNLGSVASNAPLTVVSRRCKWRIPCRQAWLTRAIPSRILWCCRTPAPAM